MALSEDARVGVADWLVRESQFAVYYDYMDGDHAVGKWASPKFKKEYDWALRASVVNHCPAAVASFSDPIEVVGTVGDSLEPGELVNLQREIGRATYECAVTGEAFIVASINKRTGEPVPTFQRADSMVPYVSQDDPAVLSHVVKVWFEGEAWRVQVTYADRIETFVGIDVTTYNARGKAKEPKILPSSDFHEPEVGSHGFSAVPIVWLKLGAVSQFAGGVSILKAALPRQDSINKYSADGLSGSEGIAMPTRYFLEEAELVDDDYIEYGDDGEPIGVGEHGTKSVELDFDNRLNSIIRTTAKSAGQFAGPNVAHTIALQQQAQADFAAVVGMPPWYGGSAPDNVSEETVKILSVRMLNRQKAWVRDNRAALDGLLELLGINDSIVFNIEIEDKPLSAESPIVDPSELKAKAESLGVMIRAGVEPEVAAKILGLPVSFTGAVPVSLRPLASDAASLEDK